MKTKLTLRMEQSVIEQAKAYAAEQGTSLSDLVSRLLRGVVLLDPPSQAAAEEDWRDALSPQTRELIGIGRGSSGEDLTEQDYKDHLVRKYLGDERPD